MNWREVIHVASGPVRHLSYVIRYSSIPILCPENVAEHSYWVSLYSILIHRTIEPENTKLIGAITTKALIHDMAECVTGDVVRTFKYSSKELKKIIDEAEDQMVQNHFPEQLKALYPLVDSMSGDDNQYVSAVVKAADFLSLHQYMRREILRGNDEIRPFYARMVSDLHAASEKESFEPIRDLYHDMAVESESRMR